MIASLQTIGDAPRSTSTLACLRDDIEESVFQSRRTIREAMPAIAWAKAAGLIRPKTQEEINQDLGNFQPVRLRGRPTAGDRKGLQAETEALWDRYQEGGVTVEELAREVGITRNALNLRFRKKRQKTT